MVGITLLMLEGLVRFTDPWGLSYFNDVLIIGNGDSRFADVLNQVNGDKQIVDLVGFLSSTSSASRRRTARGKCVTSAPPATGRRSAAVSQRVLPAQLQGFATRRLQRQIEPAAAVRPV